MRHPVLVSCLLSMLAAGCQVGVTSSSGSLAEKCAVAETAIAKTTTTTPPGPVEPPSSPTACPVCEDADGKPLPAGSCVIHDTVCEDTGTQDGGVFPTQALQVVLAAEQSPAINYYGACDNGGGQCENRDYEYRIIGNELAVATFSAGVTSVYAIPAGTSLVRSHEPIFPLLAPSAGFANTAVHVQYIDPNGALVDAYGDMQDDCRVVSGDAADVPCYCTQC